ncbi:MAG: hypothetical protein ACLTXK_05225 [Megamonas funiformis]|uniref:hypothetical protein n=2 Tax=Megamonas funiformis TaxID=437897 RepID=UPI003994FB27
MNILFKMINFLFHFWLDKMTFPLIEFVSEKLNLDPMYEEIWALCCFAFTSAIMGIVVSYILMFIYAVIYVALYFLGLVNI